MAIHALQVPCKFLVLQLLRFSQNAVSVRKDMAPIRFQSGEVVRMPIFHEGLQRMTSVIFHIGRSTNQGHYRSALSAGMYAPDGSWKYGQYLTDDDISPCLASPADEDFMRQNYYLIGFSAV